MFDWEALNRMIDWVLVYRFKEAEQPMTPLTEETNE